MSGLPKDRLLELLEHKRNDLAILEHQATLDGLSSWELQELDYLLQAVQHEITEIEERLDEAS